MESYSSGINYFVSFILYCRREIERRYNVNVIPFTANSLGSITLLAKIFLRREESETLPRRHEKRLRSQPLTRRRFATRYFETMFHCNMQATDILNYPVCHVRESGIQVLSCHHSGENRRETFHFVPPVCCRWSDARTGQIGRRAVL